MAHASRLVGVVCTMVLAGVLGNSCGSDSPAGPSDTGDIDPGPNGIAFVSGSPVAGGAVSVSREKLTVTLAVRLESDTSQAEVWAWINNGNGNPCSGAASGDSGGFFSLRKGEVKRVALVFDFGDWGIYRSLGSNCGAGSLPLTSSDLEVSLNDLEHRDARGLPTTPIPKRYLPVRWTFNK